MDCQIQNFQSFTYWFSIHKIALFLGYFLGPYSPKYGPILLRFSPEELFKQRKKVFPESLQNLSFNRNKTGPKFALSVQLWPPISPRIWQESKKIFSRKNFGHGLSKYCKTKALSLFLFWEKQNYFRHWAIQICQN